MVLNRHTAPLLLLIACFVRAGIVPTRSPQSPHKADPPPLTVTWHASYTALHSSTNQQPVMVAAAAPVSLHWGFSCKGAVGLPCAQTYFQVQVVSTTARAVVWDSGITQGNYTGCSVPAVALGPAHSYEWRPRIAVTHPTEGVIWSGWGPSRSFFTSPRSLDATPVWAQRNSTGGFPLYSFLRTRITIPADAKVVSALMFITANPPLGPAQSDGKTPVPQPSKVLSGYKVWVRGSLVGLGPGRPRCGVTACEYGDPEAVYDGYDITALIGSDVSSPVPIFVSGVGIDQPDTGGPPRIVAQIHVLVRDASGHEDEMVVGLKASEWESVDGDSTYNPSGDSGCSWYYYPQENLDASRAPPGTPWDPLGRSDGTRDESWSPAVAQPAFKSRLVPKPSDPIRVTQRDETYVRVVDLGAGRFFIDYGREFQGGVVLTVALPTALVGGGVHVRVRLAEELKTANSTSILYPPRTGTQPQMMWKLLRTPRPQTFTQHEYSEFRYAELLFAGLHAEAIDAGALRVSSWTVDVPSAPASLATNDPVLDKVWEFCRYTTQVAGLDLYSDSNARQRSEDCMADDVTAILNQYAATDQLALPKYAIEQAIGAGVAGRIDWAVLPIIAVHDYCMQTGDMDMARRVFPRLLKAHARLDTIDEHFGVVFGVEALVDWPPGMMDGYTTSNHSTVASAWVYHSTRTLARVARLIGEYSTATTLDQTASRLKAAMNKQMFNGTVMCDGICTKSPHTSFHSQVYSLAFDAVDDEHKDSVWHYIRGRMEPQETGESQGSAWPPPQPMTGFQCGAYVSQFAVQALFAKKMDRGRAGLRALTNTDMNGWVSMIRQGATMTMEMWTAEEKPNLTWSHPWAASPAYLIPSLVFGITPSAPGWSIVQIAPQPGDLERGTYTQPTIRGPITVAFNSTALAFNIEISLPASVTADVILPVGSENLDMLRVDGTFSAPTETSHDGGVVLRERLGPGGQHTVHCSLTDWTRAGQ